MARSNYGYPQIGCPVGGGATFIQDFGFCICIFVLYVFCKYTHTLNTYILLYYTLYTYTILYMMYSNMLHCGCHNLVGLTYSALEDDHQSLR